MQKQWIAEVTHWKGKRSKPRANQKVRKRRIRRKSIDALAQRLARARFKSVKLITGIHSHTPVVWWEQKLIERIKFYKESRSNGTGSRAEDAASRLPAGVSA